MTVFEGLLLAHVLGDWILQTEWQAQNKETNWCALGLHVLIYHAVVLIVLLVGFKLTQPSTYLVVAALAIYHAILDRRTSVLWLMRTLRITVHRSPEHWLVLAVDQSLHLLALGVAAAVLSIPQ